MANEQKRMKEEYFTDWLHPNKEGYTILRRLGAIENESKLPRKYEC